MKGVPLVLGVNRTQNASICLMRGSQLSWGIQKDPSTCWSNAIHPMPSSTTWPSRNAS